MSTSLFKFSSSLMTPFLSFPNSFLCGPFYHFKDYFSSFVVFRYSFTWFVGISFWVAFIICAMALCYSNFFFFLWLCMYSSAILFHHSFFKINDISYAFRSINGHFFTALASFLCCFYEAIENVVSTLWYLPPFPSLWIFSFLYFYCSCLTQFELYPQQFSSGQGFFWEPILYLVFWSSKGPHYSNTFISNLSEVSLCSSINWIL